MRRYFVYPFIIAISACSTTPRSDQRDSEDELIFASDVPFDRDEPNAGVEFTASEIRPRDIVPAEKSASELTEIGRNGQAKLTFDGHPSGVSKEVRMTARQTYLYAQLATNAYNDKKTDFTIKGVEGPLNPVKSWSGFGAQTYRIDGPDKEKICVIAFRGTDFKNPNDWIFGNLLNWQYRQGRNYFNNLRMSNQCAGQIVMVGHSLGGAIATYVSLREVKAPAFIFNTSPRLTRGSAIINERIAVSQYSEGLALFRHILPLAGGTYTTINCQRGNPASRHKIKGLAQCLTAIAAADAVTSNSDDPAVRSAVLNDINFNGPLLVGRKSN